MAPDPSNSKTAKFHKMVGLLQSHPEGLGLKSLSATLSVDTRTIKRYLADIRRFKFDLVTQSVSGNRCLYHIRTGKATPAHFIPGLKKIRTELHSGGNPKYTALITQLVRHLEEKDSPLDKDFSLSAPDIYYVDHGPFSEADPSPGILKLLEAAIASRTTVKLAYSGYAPKEGEFLFFPYTLSLRVGTLYLIGHQGENCGAFKSLSVKRIGRCIATRETFNREPFEPADFYKFCFGQWARQAEESPETVLLALEAAWLEKYLGESHFNPPGKIIRKDKKVFFEIKMVIKPDFVNWILSLTPDLLPVKPESLRMAIRERMQSGLRGLD